MDEYLGRAVGPDLEQDAPDSVDRPAMISALSELRDLSGRQSVEMALGNLSLVLHATGETSDKRKLVRLIPPEDEQIPVSTITQCRALFEDLSSGAHMLYPQYYEKEQRLRVPRAADSSRKSKKTLHFADVFGNDGAVLATKAMNWPSKCPRFCLYVMLDHTQADTALVESLLVQARERGDLYMPQGWGDMSAPRVNKGDWQMLKTWARSVGVLRNQAQKWLKIPALEM
jgi:hypothetical protein